MYLRSQHTYASPVKTPNIGKVKELKSAQRRISKLVISLRSYGERLQSIKILPLSLSTDARIATTKQFLDWSR